MSHQEIKEELLRHAKEAGISATDAKVLSIDPFYVGSPKDYQDAEWAARLWDQMMEKRGKPLHLRGFHYWIQSKAIPKPDGVNYAYEDPAKDWTFLLHCAQVARYLSIGTWQNLIDLKHPNPSDYDNYWVGSGLAKTGEVDIQSELDSIQANLVDALLGNLLKLAPSYHTEGYQLYHLEVWCEKGSMGFVIEPACKRYDACYQPLVGQASVEKVEMAARRALKAAQAGKKVRIFYIADFDRYGWTMVSAVARKLEFNTFGKSVDLKLIRLALNDDQIEKFHLPRAPKHGEEVVELDALEAIHPGKLGEIVSSALKPYYDSEKPKQVSEENRKIQERARQLLEEKLRKPLEQVFSEIDIGGIADGFTLTEAMGDFTPPEPQHEVSEDDSWVFDSNRNYWDQLIQYKKYKGSRLEEKV